MKNINLGNKRIMEVADAITIHLSNRFILYGFRNFSMDYVSSSLHLSKKTIYRKFKTKEELIRAVLIRQLSEAYTSFVSIIQSQSNVVDKFIELSKIIEKYFSVFNETSLARLRQYFPELAEYIEQFKTNRIIPIINLLLKIGKKKQLILDIPDEIIMKVFNSALSDIAQSKSEFQSELSYETFFRKAFNFLLNGILTKKGKQILRYKIEVDK